MNIEQLSAQQLLLEQSLNGLHKDFDEFKNESRASAVEVRSLISELRHEISARGGFDTRVLLQASGILAMVIAALWGLAIAPINGKLDNLIEQQKADRGWQLAIESSRFTRADGQMLLEQLEDHESLPGHPIGMERIEGTKREIYDLLDGPQVKIDQLEEEFDARVLKQEELSKKLNALEVEVARRSVLKERVDDLEDQLREMENKPDKP